MSIVQTITDEYYFWDWLKRSDNYGNNFSIDGAKALQAYLEEYSEETGEPVDFDPIAWCVEFTEYDSFEGFKKDTGYTQKDMEDLRDNTTVIELDNGGIIIADF